MKTKFIVHLCTMVFIGHHTESTVGAPTDKDRLPEQSYEYKNVDFSISHDGSLRLTVEAIDETNKLITTVSSIPAVVQEVSVTSKKKYRVKTFLLQNEKKVIESYHHDEKGEYLKTLEISTSNGHRFTIRFRDGEYVLER